MVQKKLGDQENQESPRQQEPIHGFGIYNYDASVVIDERF
jgi:hypothetical protein